jgi:hypothetical protein
VHKGLLRWDHGSELRSRRVTWFLPAKSAADPSSLDVAFLGARSAPCRAVPVLTVVRQQCNSAGGDDHGALV